MADARELYLLRHAHAGDRGDWEGPDDERPLTERGRAQSERLGEFLRSVGFEPDAIISSPKVRARETAELVAAALGREVRLDDRLGDEVTLRVVDDVIADAGSPRRPVLVGHDPDFSALVALLVGASAISMKKAALARIDTPDKLSPGRGVLRWLIPPDLLGRQ